MPSQHTRATQLRPTMALLITTLLAAALSLAARQSAVGAPSGTTFSVNTTDDTSVTGGCTSAPQCSLRDAIRAANALAGSDQIDLPPGIYLLASKLPTIIDGLYLSGALSSTTILDGNARARVLHVGSGVAVTLSNMTVRNGAPAAGLDGGGVLNEGRLTLTEVLVSDNLATGITESTRDGGDGGGIYNAGHLTIITSELRNNRAAKGADNTHGSGGAIFNAGGTITITTSLLEGNSADHYAGAIFNWAGIVVIGGSTISNNSGVDGDAGGVLNTERGSMSIAQSQLLGNQSGRRGGGIANWVGSTMSLHDSTVVGNSAVEGGGIFDAGGALLITRSSIRANIARSASGGGILRTLSFDTIREPTDTNLHMYASSIISNTAALDGGGLAASFEYRSGSEKADTDAAINDQTISNSTISGNISINGLGGGVYSSFKSTASEYNDPIRIESWLTLANSTLANNSAVQGGGIANTSGTVNLSNSLLANNNDTDTSEQTADCVGTLTSLGNNLVRQMQGCAVDGDQRGNLLGLDPQLGPLTMSGRALHTHALLPTSPAIDAGSPNGCSDDVVSAVAEDQRGVSRPQDGDGDGVAVCDIGSYELLEAAERTPPAITATPRPTRTITTTPTRTVTPTITRTPTVPALGDGFLPPKFYSLVPQPVGLAVGDLNNDNAPDLAITDNWWQSTDVQILLSKPDGTFTSTTRCHAGYAPYGIAYADFNRDGKGDLAVASRNSKVLSILLGNGDGTCAPPVNYGFIHQVDGVIFVLVADLNQDGATDIIINTSADTIGDPVAIFLNQGGGTFEAPLYLYAGANAVPSALADLDHDHLPDLVLLKPAGDLDDGHLKIMRGNGDGTFVKATDVLAHSSPKTVAAADVNADGNIDLIVANVTSDDASVLLGNGDLTFQAARHYKAGDYPYDLKVRDVNRNGTLDLIIANPIPFSSYVSVLEGNGDGTFKAPENYPAGAMPVTLGMGDFNGDRLPDIAAITRDISIAVLLNKAAPPVPTASGPTRTPINTATPTPRPKDSESAQVSLGGWSVIQDAAASGGAYRTAGETGQTLGYQAPASTSVALVTYRGPDQGLARVLIDGVEQRTLDLYAATPEHIVVESFTGLANTSHLLEVVVLGEQNPSSTGSQVRVDGFIVAGRQVEESNGKVGLGSWRRARNAKAQKSTYRVSATSGASIRLSFSGTQLTWLTARGPRHGQAEVLVDGVSRGVFDLYRPSLQWQHRITIGGLSTGPHQAEIRVLGSKNSLSAGTKVIFDAYSGG